MDRAMFQRVTPERPHNNHQHPGWAITIKELFQHRQHADTGYVAALYDVYDDLYDADATLAGLVDQRVDALAGCDITITAGDNTSEAKEIAHDFHEMWQKLDTATLLRHHQRGRCVYGFGDTELLLDWVPDRKRHDIVGLVHPPARYHRIATSAVPWVPGARPYELLIQIDDYGTTFSRRLPGKWVESRMQGFGLPLQSQGLMRQSSILAVMKREAYGDWFLYLRRHGIPFVVAEISSWTDAEAVAEARRALASLGSTRGFIAGKSDEINYRIHDGMAAARSSASDVHQRFVQGADLQMAKRWNGAALPTESAGSNSYALAREQGGIRFALLKGDKVALQNDFERGIVHPWMRFNRITGPAPRVQIGLARVEDPHAVVKIAKDMDDVGAAPDPGYLHEVTGIPGRGENAA